MTSDFFRRISFLACSSLALAGLGGAYAGAAVEAVAKIRAAGAKQEASDAAVEQALARLAQEARAHREKWKAKSFEEFEKSVYRERFPGGKYILNGDVAIDDRDRLRDYFEQEIRREPTAKLIVHQVNGKDAVWSASEKKMLTYCTARPSAITTTRS